MSTMASSEDFYCVGDTSTRNSCTLSPAELGEYDGISGIRIMFSCLSIIGTLSIIGLAIGKRQVFKSKVHPIFVLSLADFALALLWIIGGAFWLRRVDNKIWCLVVSLLSVIMQCITINLTLIYAILAYHTLKKSKETPDTLVMNNIAVDKVWKSSFTIGVYAIAWIAPVVIVMLTFAIVAGSSKEIVTKANNCSCWCLPSYGNVLPYAFALDSATAKYTYSISKLLAAYGSVVSLHYLVVFTLLVYIYHKILKHIKQKRQDPYYEKAHRTYNYGGISNPIAVQQQSQARTRIVIYVLVFIINGLINFLLSLGLTFYEAVRLPLGPQLAIFPGDRATRPTRVTFIVVLMLQALSLPLQGFLNAIIYGWTRSDFIRSVALVPHNSLTGGVPEEDEVDGMESEPQGQPVTIRSGRNNKKKKISSSASLLYSRKVDSDLEDLEPELTDTET